MKSNFDFLNRYWPALAQIGATAETYVYSDPNACIYKLGMFAERLVQEILVFEHIAEPAVDNTHANRIRILKRAGLLPHEIDNTLYVLRKTRNSAVHIGTDSVDEAKTLLSLTYNLAVWFMETYGDWGYIAPEFVMPSETTREDLESVIAEQERKIEELTKQLAVVKTAASGKTQKERARRSESVSAMMNWNEAQTRCLIDEQLRLSGWEADTQNLRYSKGTRPVKGRNIAISEWPTNSAFYKNGYADYAFFVGEKLVALMDAKKMSEDVASTIDVQVKDYAAHIKPEDIPHTVGNWNGYQVPFQEYTGTDEQDKQYYELVANAFSNPKTEQKHNSNTRFYIQKRTPFYVGKERYFEVTLQQADIYASKYNRITAYTQLDISTGYSVQIDYVPSFINLWGVDTEIKIITAWRVSVDPKCLNKLGKILNMRLQLSSKYGEYDALMRFLTETGMDFLEMIDLREIHFSHLLESVYNKTNTSYFKDVLQQLRDNYSTGSTRFGRYTVRYLLLNLREDLLERVMPSQFNPQWKCRDLYLSKKCFPFERNPLASDLADSKTSQLSQAKYLARVVEKEKTEIAVPYWSIVKSMQDTGEIYCNLGGDLTEQAIQKYNDCLDDWERQKGYEIISDGNVACIAAYEASTLFILNKLLELSQLPNKGQKEVNERYLRDCNIAFSDPKKEEALKYAFVNSRVLLIYGAAGTGKTTLIDMISTMLSGRRKLFLTKTHTALQNLQRRINNPGADASFVSINSFTKRVNLPDYDVIFVDECSTIDNRAMKVFLEKMRPDTFLVLAGDTYQIESIDFGNWFTYAKDIIKTKGSNVELVSTWRTKDPGLIELWNETRNKGALITEKLVIDGPFSENIGEGVLNSEIMDEVILCLNYDGKFGLNNMNSYFQNANTETAVVWRDWKYKVGDHILFNDTDRFSLLYNNLKGQIVQIELFDSRIIFTVDVEIPLTEQDCQNDGIEFIDIIDDVTRIRFDVLDFEEEMADEDRKKAIVPFQLAYAVSIHKAQGLEYRSVKVVIPSSNAEKITHGIFYTAITRAKEKLKIYWSSETMQEVVAGFSVDTSRQKSLAIIKEKLKQDKNT